MKKKPRVAAAKKARTTAKKAVRKAPARAAKRTTAAKKARGAAKRTAVKARKKVAPARAKRATAAKKRAQKPAKKRVQRAIVRKKAKTARRPARAAQKRVARVAARKKVTARPKAKKAARPARPAKAPKRLARPAKAKRAAKAKAKATERAARRPERRKVAKPAKAAKAAKAAKPAKAAKAERAAQVVERELSVKEVTRKLKTREAPKERELEKERPAKERPGKERLAKERPGKERPAKERPAKEKLVARDRERERDRELEELPEKGKLKGKLKGKDKLKGKALRGRDEDVREGKVRKGGKADKPREGRLIAVREPAPRVVALPLPMLPPQRRPSIEERSATIEQRLAAQSEDFRRRYIDSLTMSWIYHDSALEGVVYTFEELRTALHGQAPPVTDTNLQPTYDDIRRHREAIEFVRDAAVKKLPVTIDVIKKIYLILHPEEGDIKTVKYRKDIPQHRLYFHEYAPPDKIPYKVRQIVDWLNDPETRKTRNGLRIAARAHYDLLRVYPFQSDSGKVSRLFMNLLLLKSGLPPSIIHSTERQRYYEALKGSATTVLQMVQESVENALASVEKLVDEHESRKRAFVS
ncbi:Fic family protein [Polyangium aurulentum]|uniref:Fic family protein n=1 Tax=Polyangium aurulentum TaxID=2567896 RepID=UPI001F1584BB|nr:Fic family protein [Polyangium aurulentum]